MKKIILITFSVLILSSGYAQFNDVRLHAKLDSYFLLDFKPEAYYDTLGQYIITMERDFTYNYSGVLVIYDTENLITKKITIPITHSEWIVNNQNPIRSSGNKWSFSFIVSDLHRGAGIIIAPSDDDIEQNRAFEYKFISFDYGTTWKIQVATVETEPSKK